MGICNGFHKIQCLIRLNTNNHCDGIRNRVCIRIILVMLLYYVSCVIHNRLKNQFIIEKGILNEGQERNI